MTPTTDSIRSLVEPSSIAVVGASNTSFVGNVLCRNLRALGYSGAVYPVNPRADEVEGWRCFPALDELPEAPEAVALAVRIDRVPEALRAAAKLGARAAVVPGGGFSETGPAALQAQADIAEIAREFEICVAGPNCMGVLGPPARAAMYIGTVPPSLLAGAVALVSQSGSVVEAMVNMGPRVGFSAIVSCGTEAVTTIGDYLQYFAEDETTSAVGVFVEGFRDPGGFVAGARALRDAGKPLAVLQAGRSPEASAAIAAHSGTLAGRDEVVTGLLHQLGAIGVDDLDELVEVCELLANRRLPRGRRLFVVTDSGGESQLIADHARRLDLELPPPSREFIQRLRGRWPNFAFIANPVDPWGVDPDFETLYAEILHGAAAEDVDVLAVALDKVTPWMGENELDLSLAAGRGLINAARGTDKVPIFFTVHSTGPADEPLRSLLRDAGVPLLHGVRPALIAIRRASWWRAWRRRSDPAVSTSSRPLTLGDDERGPILSERASRDVFAAYGIPVVQAKHAEDPGTAGAAAERIGFPVVVKADVPGLAHRTAAGLIRSAIVSAGAVRDSFDALRDAATRSGLPFRGVLVERMARGVEVFCGMRRDPLFGPVVILGVGGPLAEAIRDVAVRVCPPSREDLEEMLAESAVGRLLEAGGADAEPVIETLSALAGLARDHPEVQEAEVNPLFVRENSAEAADALVVVASASEEEGQG